MLLQLSTGEPFATGAAAYAYVPASEREETPRITLDVLIGNLRTSAFVDTGGVYLICSPQIAAALNLDPVDGLRVPNLIFRGAQLPGVLHRIPLTILASQGETITLEATAFVPGSINEWSDFPCILGIYLCLDRLRFAVDPINEVFYFGEPG